MLPRFLYLTAIALLWGPTMLAGTSVAEQLTEIYGSRGAEDAALSPDGAHVALAVRTNRGLEIQILNTADSGSRRRLTLDPGRRAESSGLTWLSSDWLVAASDAPLVVAIDAAHDVMKRLVDPKTFRRVAADSGGPVTIRVLNTQAAGDSSIDLEVTTHGVAAAEMPGKIALYHCDVPTGQLTPRFDRTVDPPGASLIVDRQGEPRILFERGVLPQAFTYHQPGGERWRPLDAVLSNKQAFRFAVTAANFLGERTIPLCFDLDPSILYYASNVGRDTFAIYAVDLRTGTRLPFHIEDPHFDLADLELPWIDSPLVFDRQQRRLVGVRSRGIAEATVWLDSDLKALQETLNGDFPGRQVRVLEWDAHRTVFLLNLGSLGQPGRFLLYRPASRTYLDLANRSGPTVDDVNPVEAFSFPARDKLTVNGYLTLPRAAPVAKPALVLWLHDGPWQRVPPSYRRDAQALAAMGFAVAEINYRGSSGFGRAFRDAFQRDFSDAPIDDAIDAISWLSGHYHVDSKRVAVMGEGFGGYLALRAAERYPDQFRATVAINSVLSLEAMKDSAADITNRRSAAAAASDSGFTTLTSGRAAADLAGGGAAIGQGGNAVDRVMDAAQKQAAHDDAVHGAEDRLVEAWTSLPLGEFSMSRSVSRRVFRGLNLWRLSVSRDVAKLTTPVLLIQNPEHPDRPIGPVRELRDTLAARKVTAEYFEISRQFDSGPLMARAPVFVRIGEFLNASLYDFHVRIGNILEKD